jgi:hypothetical protein
MRPGMSFEGTLPPKGFAAVVAGTLCPEAFEMEVEYVWA